MTSILNSKRFRPKSAQLIGALFFVFVAGIAGAYWLRLSSAPTSRSTLDQGVSAPAPIIIKWATRREARTVGYVISRAENSAGPFVQLNRELIPAVNDPYLGGTYVYTDTETVAGVTYYYRLEDVASDGKRTAQDPIAVTARFSSPTIFGWVISESAYPIIAFAVAGFIGLAGTAIWIIIRR